MTLGTTFDFLFQWHLTELCNLHCRHCYQSGHPENELSLAEKRDLLDEIDDLLSAWAEQHGVRLVPSFNITGGEPLLSHDLFPVMEEIARRGHAQYLLTNGTLITPDISQRLADLQVAGVQVSLEGPPAVHDAIRGAGSYAAAAAGTGHLLKSGILVTLNVTLSRVNASHLDAMLSLAAGMGVQRIGLNRLVPYGHGRDMSGEMLTPGEARSFYEAAFAASRPGLEVVTGDPVAARLASPHDCPPDSPPIGGCAAGVSGLTISADGTILPCRRLPIPIGNVRTDSLRELWATSGVLTDLRDRSRYAGRCGTCSRWSICRGCRGVAYAYAGLSGDGDYLAEDPQCFI